MIFTPTLSYNKIRMSTQRPITSFDSLPLMVEYLMNKIEGLEAKIEALAPSKSNRTTIDIDAAVEITQKTKSTIYKLVRTGKIPAYKRGKKLYFIKEELEEWMFMMPKHSISTNSLSSSPSARVKSALEVMKPSVRRRFGDG